jgi:hypothetical protein
MKTNLVSITTLLLVFWVETIYSQPTQRHIKTKEYVELQQKLCTGWNTWYNNSIICHALLPEGFAINLSITKKRGEYAKEFIKASKVANRPEEVVLGLRSDDGSYTSLNLKYNDDEINVQSAIDGVDQLLLVTPVKTCKQSLIVEPGILWNKNGSIGFENGKLFGRFVNRVIEVSTTEPLTNTAYDVATLPRFCISLKKEIGIFTGNYRTLNEIKATIEKKRKQQETRIASYGELTEPFKAMQTILAWNTIYDARNQRAITPVSRLWNRNWNGFVLFEWDTYFASYMFSLFNKDLAYANSVEITKAITQFGFVPNYSTSFGASWDRSQPPVGSTIILEIYKRYKEKWFLNETYDELLTWNRWWPKNRDKNGYLAWGSDNPSDTLVTIKKNNMQAAMYESGLDNSPMYDSVPFNHSSHIMELADVGLMSLYIMDCNSMAEISDILGKTKEAKELRERSSKYNKQLATMWDDEKGIFLNKRTDTGKKSYRLSPTNFYPMLSKTCTQKQADRMMKEHYFNPNQFYGEYVMPSIARNDSAFKDNDYWRGRIWAPMNFLVYLGMRNYKLPDAKANMVEKSKNLLTKSWNENGAIYENYNSTTGVGDDVKTADGFYHWGALLTFMSFIEKGYMNDACDLKKK